MIKALRKLADFLEQERCQFIESYNSVCESLKITKKLKCDNCLCEDNILCEKLTK